MDAADGEPHAMATAMNAVPSDTAGLLVNAPTPEDVANLIYTSGESPGSVELLAVVRIASPEA